MTYVDVIADQIRAELDPPPDASAENAALFRLYALLLLTRGSAVTARDVHDAWVVWMLGRGEQHPSMVSFDHLPAAVQHEDDRYVRAIRRVSGAYAQNDVTSPQRGRARGHRLRPT